MRRKSLSRTLSRNQASKFLSQEYNFCPPKKLFPKQNDAHTYTYEKRSRKVGFDNPKFPPPLSPSKLANLVV